MAATMMAASFMVRNISAAACDARHPIEKKGPTV
jgi:hypothetical protein